MTESSEIELSSTRLRGASAFQQLHWLASGRVSAAQLTETYLSAIDQHNPALNAYVCVDSGAALAASTSVP